MTIDQLAAATGANTHVLRFVLEVARRHVARGMNADDAIQIGIDSLGDLTEQMYRNVTNYGARAAIDIMFGDGMFEALSDDLYDALRAKAKGGAA